MAIMLLGWRGSHCRREQSKRTMGEALDLVPYLNFWRCEINFLMIMPSGSGLSTNCRWKLPTDTKAQWAYRAERPMMQRSLMQYVFRVYFHIELPKIRFTVSGAVINTKASGTWIYVRLFVSLMVIYT